MRLHSSWLAAVILVICVGASAPAHADRARWDVARTIEFTRVDRGALADRNSTGVSFAPDRRHVLLATTRGDLECDCNIAKIWIFETDAVEAALAAPARRPLAPIASFEQRSSSTDGGYHRAIMEARWADNNEVEFYGVDAAGVRQFFTYTLGQDSARQHTYAPDDVYGVQRAGEAVLYAYSKAPDARSDPIDRHPAFSVADISLFRLLNPDHPEEHYFLAAASGSGERVLLEAPSADTPGLIGDFAPWQSPDGRWAIVLLRGASEERAFEFNLIELATGEKRVLGMSAMGLAGYETGTSFARAFWSADSSSVLLVNAVTNEDRGGRGFVISYTLGEQQVRVVSRMAPPEAAPPGAQGWSARAVRSAPDQPVLLSYSASLPGYQYLAQGVQRFDYEHEGWVVAESPAPAPTSPAGVGEAPALSVVAHEDQNTPPRFIARLNGREFTLLDLNPAMRNARFAAVREVEWVDPDGAPETGALILPVRARNSVPPPLVIQAYSYDPSRFEPDGPFSTGYAAQALAAEGIAVLLIDIPAQERANAGGSERTRITGSPEEGRYFVNRVDRAVAHLAAQGLIDAERVGLVGFSRGGWSSLYAITHPGETEFSAAVMADAASGSYGAYVADLVLREARTGARSPTQHERIMGGDLSPFWSNRAAWLAEAPLFNVQSVRTPSLFSQTDLRLNSFAISETIAAYRALRVPFEYLILPGGSHELYSPRQREASLQATVDWMTFWLLGRERASADAVQIARWRRMREGWESRAP